MAVAPVIVIGAGMGGLAAAVTLASRGEPVVLLEASDAPGGKMREVVVDGAPVDSGPTVLTMRDVFEGLFADAGDDLAARVGLRRADILARHAWDDGARFDLHADLDRSADAVAALAGKAEAERFRAFAARARAIFRTLDTTFMRAPRPSPIGLVRAVGPTRLGALFGLSPFATLWSALGEHFHDPRLRQLFGRYATYVGSSPFLAPATLMLIAHAELDGVWLVEGGMHRLAVAMSDLATRAGVDIRYGARVARIAVEAGRARAVVLDGGERIEAGAVLHAGDASALGRGLLGPDVARALDTVPPAERSLSALTWSVHAPARGFPLARHTVFFSADYPAEFADIFRARRLPTEPTVYVCAQDRDDAGTITPDRERLLVLVNAPADGDRAPLSAEEIARCETRTFARLERHGLSIPRDPETARITTPSDFERLFPGSGGAIYGRASHGWTASFRRPGSRTRIPGLYLAGGSVHPGAGIPMATMSGRLAAWSVLSDLASTSTSRRAAMRGGTSTR